MCMRACASPLAVGRGEEVCTCHVIEKQLPILSWLITGAVRGWLGGARWATTAGAGGAPATLPPTPGRLLASPATPPADRAELKPPHPQGLRRQNHGVEPTAYSWAANQQERAVARLTRQQKTGSQSITAPSRLLPAQVRRTSQEGGGSPSDFHHPSIIQLPILVNVTGPFTGDVKRSKTPVFFTPRSFPDALPFVTFRWRQNPVVLKNIPEKPLKRSCSFVGDCVLVLCFACRRVGNYWYKVYFCSRENFIFQITLRHSEKIGKAEKHTLKTRKGAVIYF